jgi:hypothetical protein
MQGNSKIALKLPQNRRHTHPAASTTFERRHRGSGGATNCSVTIDCDGSNGDASFRTSLSAMPTRPPGVSTENDSNTPF